MGFLDGIFGRKRRTLEDLSLDDLKRERITLQTEQRKLDQELERVDHDEQQLKSEYAEAASDVQKKAIARRIQTGRTQRRALDTKSSYCHKMLQTVANFTIIKENMEFFDRVGVASALTQMDTSELEQFIDQATVEGTLQQEKLAGMLQQVSDGVDRLTEAAGDDDLDVLMAELDGDISDSPERSVVADDGLESTMRELDQAIARGEQAARNAATQRGKDSPERRQRES